MTNNQFKVGDAVVFNRKDGSSQSATVTEVQSTEIQITYRSAPNCLNNVWITRSEFYLLTKFPAGCLFMVTK